jgi:hypothetical protein
LYLPKAATFLGYPLVNDPSRGNLAMKWLLLLPIPLALGACEVGHIKMPMAPMTLGPADAQAPCDDANATAASGACRTQGPR